MDIQIKLVEDYPKEVLEDLMTRNLEQSQVFFHPDSFLEGGDPNYQRICRKVKVAAYDGERLIGLSYGKGTDKHRFMMEVSLVEMEYRSQGIYAKMLECML